MMKKLMNDKLSTRDLSKRQVNIQGLERCVEMNIRAILDDGPEAPMDAYSIKIIINDKMFTFDATSTLYDSLTNLIKQEYDTLNEIRQERILEGIHKDAESYFDSIDASDARKRVARIKFRGNIYDVMDETETHYVCPPESAREGYHYITKKLAAVVAYA